MINLTPDTTINQLIAALASDTHASTTEDRNTGKWRDTTNNEKLDIIRLRLKAGWTSRRDHQMPYNLPLDTTLGEWVNGVIEATGEYETETRWAAKEWIERTNAAIQHCAVNLA